MCTPECVQNVNSRGTVNFPAICRHITSHKGCVHSCRSNVYKNVYTSTHVMHVYRMRSQAPHELTGPYPRLLCSNCIDTEPWGFSGADSVPLSSPSTPSASSDGSSSSTSSGSVVPYSSAYTFQCVRKFAQHIQIPTTRAYQRQWKQTHRNVPLLPALLSGCRCCCAVHVHFRFLFLLLGLRCMCTHSNVYRAQTMAKCKYVLLFQQSVFSFLCFVRLRSPSLRLVPSASKMSTWGGV